MKFISLGVAAGLALAACNSGPGVRLTPQQQSDFAEEMTEPDQLATGQIPPAGSFPGR